MSIEPKPSQTLLVPEEYAHIYRRKTRLQLIRISAAVMGIEFCYAAETAFVSPTLLKIGISHAHMTLIWCLSPLVGFFLTPVLGSLSDGCNLRLGRRRPFIIALSVGIIFGLLLVPNGKDLGIAMGDHYSEPAKQDEIPIDFHLNAPLNLSQTVNMTITKTRKQIATESLNQTGHESHLWSILFTVIGTVLLDFNADACQSPSRAYLLDVTVADDHAIGLSTFTIMAGLGGSMGYAMGAINWDSTTVGHAFGGHVRSVFTVILFIFIGCIAVTLFSFTEIPLDMLNLRNLSTKPGLPNKLENCDTKVNKMKSSSWLPFRKGYKRFSDDDIDDDDIVNDQNTCEKNDSRKSNNYDAITNSAVLNGRSASPNDNSYGTITKNESPNKETSFIEESNDIDQTTLMQSTGVMGVMSQENKETVTDTIPVIRLEISPTTESVELKQYLSSIIHLPQSMKALCLTNLFCWMSIVSYSLYFTDFVGEAVFNGNPTAPDNSPTHQLYEEGIRYGCWGMAVYSLSCSAYSLVIDKLICTFQTKSVYIGGQLVYSIGMLLLATTRHKLAVILLSSTTGIMYATVFTMPYILVAQYHTHKIFDVPGKPTKIRGIGTDVAVVSSMVFLAQFILSACMGAIVNATGSTISVIMLASLLSFLGAICATQVTYV